MRRRYHAESCFGQCADLTAEGIDVSAVQPELLEECTFDGKVLRIPFAQNRVGMVVNKTLLEKEGLSVYQLCGLPHHAGSSETGRLYLNSEFREQHLY